MKKHGSFRHQVKVTVIGGGTGTATVLAALVGNHQLDLTAIVAVSDSGGSTGRLRDEFGFIPVGDVRQCLAALAVGENAKNVKDLLLYRFDRGAGLAGHSLGNLILTALTDLYHNPGRAIEVASQILRINGQVYPVSEQPAELIIHYADGRTVVGEDYLNYQENGGTKITGISLDRQTLIYAKAAQAIREARVLIIGPGDLYASLLPNAIVPGFREAMALSRAPLVYIANLMSTRAQTYQMTARDHVAEITKYVGRSPDIVIINRQPITDQQLIASYQAAGLAPLVDDLEESAPYRIIRAGLVSPVVATREAGDALPRSFLRHHPHRLREIIESVIHECPPPPPVAPARRPYSSPAVPAADDSFASE